MQSMNVPSSSISLSLLLFASCCKLVGCNGRRGRGRIAKCIKQNIWNLSQVKMSAKFKQLTAVLTRTTFYIETTSMVHSRPTNQPTPHISPHMVHCGQNLHRATCISKHLEYSVCSCNCDCCLQHASHRDSLLRLLPPLCCCKLVAWCWRRYTTKDYEKRNGERNIHALKHFWSNKCDIFDNWNAKISDCKQTYERANEPPKIPFNSN